MSYTTLISAQELTELCGDDRLLVVDCRHDLAAPQQGAVEFATGHLPNARYADLQHDLSDLSKQGLGRHPLPDPERFAAVLRRWGWAPDMQVVAYDHGNGAIAARLWWMLRLVGHREVAVLDGGYAGWVAADLPLETSEPPVGGADVDLGFDARQIVYHDELKRGLADGSLLLIDARAAPRYRGETEPLDPVAGHVPGARNRPFGGNLDAAGRFKAPGELGEEFSALLGGRAPGEVVHMCGSGVTACHNLLAMEHAGLTGSRVFAPSWSGWVADRSRPVAVGAEPG